MGPLDRSVVIAMLPNADAAQAVAGRLHRIGLDPARRAVVRSACLPEDGDVVAAVVLDPGRAPVLVDGFLVRSLLASIDEEREVSRMLAAVPRRAAIPRRAALAYVDAIQRGAALLALLTPDREIDRSCRALEAAGAYAPSVHHFPSTRSPQP